MHGDFQKIHVRLIFDLQPRKLGNLRLVLIYEDPRVILSSGTRGGVISNRSETIVSNFSIEIRSILKRPHSMFSFSIYGIIRKILVIHY